MIVCTYSCVCAHFVSEIFQKILIERENPISQLLAVKNLFLGLCNRSLSVWIGEGAPIFGVIAELIFKAPGMEENVKLKDWKDLTLVLILDRSLH